MNMARQNILRKTDSSDGYSPHWLMTRGDVARVFGLSKRWLEVAACRGEGPPIVRISSRMVRYRFRDVEEWIASQVDHGSGGEVSK
ncbi:helix-turn-helix domain-containing protein [Aestuariicoccus sp. MJ-SS9]|uniref:helix-turn-helix transcriptional regulator n=1 Tax=Aestuariicoccus sp. MJ-SS9 TaxID=3079855 RepID=UPI002915229E|nr:helix-turn-helix domain-containing protein [Aestuariicoccus sp. MJ-SS9]MDU8913608.1 helix-turn-helix domain-containing protein [Aestuariicoccus sp. MJ-SS9]